MPAADTDRTSELPSIRAPRRRAPALLVTGAVALAGLGYVVVTNGGDRRPETSVAAAAADGPTSTAVGAPPAPTTSQPVATSITPPPAVPSTTSAPPPPERLTVDSRLSLSGIGPVEVGMTLAEASAAAGTPIRTRPEDPFGPECEYAYTAEVPEVAFMVIDGRIARVDVGHRPGRRVTTVSGVGKGDTEDAVKRTYPGRIRTGGHPYVPTGHYLVYEPADPALAHLGMIFETDGRVVTSFRAGMKGAVSQIEGCS